MFKQFSLLPFFCLAALFAVAQNPTPVRGPSAQLMSHEGCECDRPMWQISMKDVKPVNWKQIKKKIDKEAKKQEGYCLVKVWLDESGNYCSHKWLQFTTEEVRNVVEPFLSEVQFEPVTINEKQHSFCVEIPFQFGEPR